MMGDKVTHHWEVVLAFVLGMNDLKNDHHSDYHVIIGYYNNRRTTIGSDVAQQRSRQHYEKSGWQTASNASRKN